MENVSVHNLNSRIKQYADKISTIRVVIPALNEEKNLESLLIELKALGYLDVIVIDGKSIDQTFEVAKKHGAKVILQNGRGKGDAVRQVLNNDYMDVDALVLMDADGSMDPKEIPFFVKSLKSGADIVKGSRFLNGGYTHDINFLRRIGNGIFTSTVNLFFSTKYSDLCYGFMVFNRRSVELMSPLLKSQNFEIETEILIKAKKLGLKVIEVPSTEFKRKNGKSNLNTFKDGFKILQTIFQSYLT
ncbi:MAG: glycosyltransferase [Dehalococcoidia bacterium]|nr:MAG: glycosyltransferase [Dehalococcoidia bacterium]